MKHRAVTVLAGLLLLVCLCLAGGCGRSVKLTPVRGKVTLDGKPVTAGQVSLLPAEEPTELPKEGAGPKAGLSAGQIESTGDYKIFTGGKEGAPAGKYKVTVTPSMMPMGAPDAKKAPPLPFPQKYGDPQNTPLRIEVGSGSYDLKMSSK